MTRTYELKFSFTFLLSIFLHLVILSLMIIPLFHDLMDAEKLMRGGNTRLVSGRDIIVNINQDEKRVMDERTVFGEKDSSARGFITKVKGNKWLNNSLDFQLRQGKSGSGSGRRAVSVEKEKFLLSDESEVVMLLSRSDPYGNLGMDGSVSMDKIPDKWDITKQNAVYYSNDGTFSFNTLKFKNFEYFRNMVRKVSSNWFPPEMANTVLFGYAPGYTRIMAIPNQEVKLYFIMDRSGEVKKVKLEESYGNDPLDRSCVDAIRFSKNFGKIPDDIKGNPVVIPFIFRYIVE